MSLTVGKRSRQCTPVFIFVLICCALLAPKAIFEVCILYGGLRRSAISVLVSETGSPLRVERVLQLPLLFRSICLFVRWTWLGFVFRPSEVWQKPTSSGFCWDHLPLATLSLSTRYFFDKFCVHQAKLCLLSGCPDLDTKTLPTARPTRIRRSSSAWHSSKGF